MTTTVMVNRHKWVYKSGDGGKPQEVAYARGLKFRHAIHVSRIVKRKHCFTSFKDVDAFWNYFCLTPIRDRYFRTIDTSYRDASTSALYLDIEWFSPTEPRDDQDSERLASLRRSVDQALSSVGSDLHLTDWVVNNFTRIVDGKLRHSYHVHVPQAVFDDNLVMGTFVKAYVLPHMHSDPLFYSADGSPIVDASIYTRNRRLRLPGCKKRSVDGSLPCPTKEVFVASLTSGCTRKSNINNFPDRQIAIARPANRRFVSIEDRAIETRITKLLRDRGDMFSTVTFVEGRLFQLAYHNDNHKCFIGGEGCTNNSSVGFKRYFVVSRQGRIFYHCLIDTAHDSAAGCYFGDVCRDNTIEWVDDEFVGEVHRYDGWDTHRNVLRREYDDEYTHKFELDFGRKALLVIAGMGKGKTTSAIDLLCSSFFKRVLYVVPRRTLGWEIMRVIAELRAGGRDIPVFQHYCDGVDGDHLVIEYESLHRLSNLKAYDLVVCDEIRSICSALTNLTTNGHNIQRNASILQAFSKAATMWVGMDADAEVDPLVPHLIQAWWPAPGTIQVDVYTVPAMHRRLHLASDEDQWICDVRAKLAEGHQVAICCRTKARAKVWVEVFVSPSVLLVTGDTSDEDTMRILGHMGEGQNINTALTSVKLFIFTSKINIGVDIQLPWDWVFLDCKGGRGAAARDLLQMSGRFRKLVNLDVRALVTCTEPTFEKSDDLIARVTEYFDRRDSVIGNQYRAVLSFDSIFDNGYLRLAPSWITQMFIYASMEHHTDFAYEMYRLCRLNLYKVFRVPDSSSNADEVRAMDTQVKKTKCSQIESIFNEVKLEDAGVVLVDGHALSRKGEGTEESRMRIECAEVLRFFTSPENVEFEQFQHAQKNLKQLRMLAVIRNMTTARLLRHEIQVLHKHPWANHTMFSKVLQCKYIDTAIQLLGVGGIDDTTTTFTTEDLATHESTLRQTLLQAAAAGGRPYTQKKMPKTISILRRELRETFGIKLHSKRRHAKLYDYCIEHPPLNTEILGMLDFGYNFDQSQPPETDHYLEERQQLAAEHRVFRITH